MEQTSPFPNSQAPAPIVSAPLVNPPSSEKPVFIIFLIVFVVVLISLNVYLFMKLQNQSKTPIASPAPIIQASPTPSSFINVACGGPLAVEPNNGCPTGYSCDNIKTIGNETSGTCIKKCTSDKDCPNNTFCDYSRPGGIGPNGLVIGKPYGSQKCIIKCQNNDQCLNKQCQTFEIVEGDINTSLKGCKL